MKLIRCLATLCLSLALSACASVETPTRGIVGQSGLAPQVESIQAAREKNIVLVSQYAVMAINVIVPRTLRVSEANVFFPIADIVWYGDPAGDRYAQVQAIYEEALARGTAAMTEGRAVVLEVEITRFHALTPKARYTVGGEHTLHFTLTVRDAATGDIVDGPRKVVADVRGSGGKRAIAEEEAGLTQKAVIENRLAEVIRRELSVPVSAGEGSGAGSDAVSRNAFSPTDLTIIE